GLRQARGAPLHRPRARLAGGTRIAAGVMAAAGAPGAAVPGMAGGRWAVTVSILPVAAAVVPASLEPATRIRSVWDFVAHGAQCVVSILAFSVLPWTALFLAVRRAAPLDASLAGAYVGAASLLFAAAAVRIACPIDEKLHVLTWHTLPIA